MCDGCQEFFKKHAGVVKAAALAHASAFVDYADLAQMVFVKVLEWKQKQIDPIMPRIFTIEHYYSLTPRL